MTFHFRLRAASLCAVAAVGACAAPRAQIALPTVSPVPTQEHHVGQIVWYDLVTDDIAAAQAFYGPLLGWSFEDIGIDGQSYVAVRHDGQPIAGMAAVDRDDAGLASAQWISLMSVADVDAAVDEFRTAGGQIRVEPWTNESRGRMAVVSDPQGALLGLVRSASGDPPASLPAGTPAGRWIWTEMWARDAAAAAAFYGGLAGYETETTTVVDAAEYRVLTSGGEPRAGLNELPWPEVQPNWLPYIKVDDPAATARRAEELGGTVLIPPASDVRNGSLALLLDPSGAAFAVQRWPIDEDQDRQDDGVPGGVGGAR
jgi:predicted enzyme related to lactoylglutathione lyase